MKILHLVHQYPPDHVGGTELYTQSLARYQAAHGHTVSVFVPSPVFKSKLRETVAEIDGGVRVYRAAVGPRSSTSVFLSTFAQPFLHDTVQRVVQHEQPDVVHIQHLMGLPVSVLDQLRAVHIPVIVTLHDYWYVCANAQLLTNYDHTVCNGPRAWINCGHCALARINLAHWYWLSPVIAPVMAERNRRLFRALAEVQRMIAPTEFVREMYRRLRWPIDRVRVIQHGIDVPAGLPHPKRPRGDELHAVYIGGLASQKGVHVLVDAMNGLVDHKIRLSIYGDMAVFPDYVQDLRQRARNPRIMFAGTVSRRDLWNVLSEADVLVVPSLWYETASLVVQEAFAAGVPVIASNLGALRERVHDGIDGALFPPGDHATLRDMLLRCAADPDWLMQLQSGIRPVRTLAEHAVDVEAVYREAIAR